MNIINISVFSILLFMGFQKAQAQIHRTENKAEIEPKAKVNEYTESVPLKEPEIKKETPPEEITPVTEHKESISVNEPEVKTDSQPERTEHLSNLASEKKEAPATSSPHPHLNITALPVQKNRDLPAKSKPVISDTQKK